MAFRSMEEFRKMFEDDPERAISLFQRASSSGRNPISKRNPGYGNAIKRRMAKQFNANRSEKQTSMSKGASKVSASRRKSLNVPKRMPPSKFRMEPDEEQERRRISGRSPMRSRSMAVPRRNSPRSLSKRY